MRVKGFGTGVMRSMTSRGAASAALSALALLSSAASAQAACTAPRHTRHTVTGSKVVAYLVRQPASGDGKGKLVGCWRSTGRRVTVARFAWDYLEQDTISSIHVAGRFVGYVFTFRDHYGGQHVRAYSYDVRDRTQRWGTTISDYDAPLGEGETSRVRAFVLAKDGAFAYLARYTTYPDGTHAVRFFARDGAGSDRLLDEGAGIDPASVSLHGQRVTWTHSGVQHSATLR
jgi:hypothetical protein